MPITASVVASKDQVSCDLDEEAVILSLRSGAYYGLNEVAAHIWSLIQEPRSVASLRDDLLAEYDVEPDDCLDELRRLLTELLEWDLIEITDEEPG